MSTISMSYLLQNRNGISQLLHELDKHCYILEHFLGLKQQEQSHPNPQCQLHEQPLTWSLLEA